MFPLIFIYIHFRQENIHMYVMGRSVQSFIVGIRLLLIERCVLRCVKDIRNILRCVLKIPLRSASTIPLAE